MNDLMDHGTHVGIFRHSLFLPSEQFIAAQARALHGIKVTMIGRDPVSRQASGLASATISDQGRGAVLRHTLLRDRAPLKRILRELNVSVVHAHFGVEGMYSLPAATSLDLPHVTTLHGFDVSLSRRALARSGRPAWLYYSLLRRNHLTSGSKLICVSDHVRRLAIGFGAAPENTVVIGTGVDTVAIRPLPIVDAPIVIHVARLVEKKGTTVLITAFAEVLKLIPDAQLRIIGDGPLRALLEVQVDSLGIRNHVIFMGVQPHSVVLQEIACARLLCLPSVTAPSGDQEGLGQVLLEAAALGRPVVATRHGGIVDGVVDGETGRLVPEHDPASLADALIELINDSKVSGRMSIAARHFVEKNFNIFNQAQKVADLYQAIR